jgi:hypothetical protein
VEDECRRMCVEPIHGVAGVFIPLGLVTIVG